MVGTLREYQHQHPAALDRLDDLSAVFDARPDVTRRDPGAHTGAFQHRARGIGGSLVVVRIADEDVQSHGPVAQLLAGWSCKRNATLRPAPADSCGSTI